MRIIIFCLLLTNVTFASTDPSVFSFDIRKAGKIRSSTYWHPLGSLFVPGLAQYMNKQTEAGFIYSGVAGVGLGVALLNVNDLREADDTQLRTDMTDPEKAFVWGLQTYQTAGSLSTYHAFRSVAAQRKEKGEFDFLTVDETTDQLMKAPFQFSYFLEPTVFVPLGVLLGGLVYYHNNEGAISKSLTLTDGLFTTGASYNAGVGEEALFRGYLMMNLRQSWSSDFWSNAATSTVFALAHLSEENRYPWPQLVLGYYFGWLAQRNQWTLSEGVFLHTWWDVIALSAALAEGVSSQTLWLPVVSLSF
jgi:hypothetical protein